MLPLETRFSGLTRMDLVLRGVPSPLSIARLSDAKHRSEHEKGLAIAVLGDPPLRVFTHAQGAKGGYRFRCTARRGSETWLIKMPVSSDKWNCRFEINCQQREPLLFLDLWNRIRRICRALDLRPTAVRVSRVDLAVELLMPPGFDPDPARFSAHSRKQLHRDFSVGKLTKARDREFRAIWAGRRIYAVAIGQLPGCEIAISRNIPRRRKSRLNPRARHRAPRNEALRDEIWRVDIRLGKKYLREIHKFTEFREAGVRTTGLFSHALGSVWYLAEGKLGSNISRHPTNPFWTGVQRAALEALERDKWL